MKNIQVTCNGTETAIIKKSSTIFLRYLLNELGIDNVKEVIDIYTRLKTFRPVSTEESALLFDVVRTKAFEEIYTKESIDKLDFEKGNEDNFTYNRLLISLTRLRTIGEVQHLLVSNAEVRYGGSHYRRIIIGGDKQKFCEVVEENDDFLTAIDLKTGKTFIYDKVSDDIVLNSTKEILLSNSYNRVRLPEGFFYAVISDKKNLDNIIFPGGNIEFSPESYVYLGKYALFIVDTNSGNLIKVEIKDLSVKEEDITNFDSIIPKGQFIITYLHHLEENDLKPNGGEEKNIESRNLAKTDLFNLELNKNLIENISEEYIDTTLKDYIICMSSNLEVVYLIDTQTRDIVEYKISEFIGEEFSIFDEHAWKGIIDDIGQNFK